METGKKFICSFRNSINSDTIQNISERCEQIDKNINLLIERASTSLNSPRPDTDSDDYTNVLITDRNSSVNDVLQDNSGQFAGTQFVEAQVMDALTNLDDENDQNISLININDSNSQSTSDSTESATKNSSSTNKKYKKDILHPKLVYL